MATHITITQGGTGATNASGARSNLGLGSLATQDASAVAITGGSIAGVSSIGASGTITTNSTITGKLGLKTSDNNGVGSRFLNQKCVDVLTADRILSWKANDAAHTFDVNCSDVTFGNNTSNPVTVIGSNTGDNATNSQYSGLAASKQDTLASGTNIKTINGQSIVGSGELNGSVALTDASTVATNCSLGNRFDVTLGSNRTLGNPTNPVDGVQYVWEIVQDGTGGRTLAFDTKFAFGTDITGVTLTTGANKRDFITAIYRSGPDKFFIVGVSKGY